NAELALINSVQVAIAGELDPQAIYDVVGDKIQEISDAQVVDIAVYDEATGVLHLPYSIEGDVRFHYEPIPLTDLGFMRQVIATREPLLLHEDIAGWKERHGFPALENEPRSAMSVPLLA